MKRDMELIRKILLAIEEQYVDVALCGLSIDGYGMKEVAYHCRYLNEAGLVSNYTGRYGGNELIWFSVGSLTPEGHDLLDKIRDDSVWGETVSLAKGKGLPLIIETVKPIASSILQKMIESVVVGITKGIQ